VQNTLNKHFKDVESRWLEDKSNEILTAIVHGMRANEPSNQVEQPNY
jgi:hypothetical protein